MAKRRVEDCLALSLDVLPDHSLPTWDLPFVIAIQWSVHGPMAGEPTKLRMTVRRRQNKLNVELAKFGSSRLFLRQSVLIFPGGPRGYREYLICDGCGARVRQLLLHAMDMDAERFRCRICHDLAYTTQFRHRNLLERMIGNRGKSGRRRARPGMESLAAFRAAARSPNPLALDVFARGPGRPPKSTPLRNRRRGRPKEKRSYERGGHSKAIVGLDEAYCVKCKLARRIAEPIRTTFRNGRPAITGACPVCGTRLWKARAGAN